MKEKTKEESSIQKIASDFAARFETQVMNCEAVSFDVFDTLIHRSVARPIDIFKIVALRMHGVDAASNIRADNFQALRVASEKLARQKAKDSTGSSEISLNDIYATLREISNTDELDAKNLLELELAVEKEMVYANPLMLQLLNMAEAAGKKVILCSDMYLPSDFILDLIEIAGYRHGLPILVSCEAQRSKHEGTIFPLLTETLSIAPSKILHIGDNHLADVQMPAKAGLTSLHFDMHERAFKNISRTLWKPDRDWGTSSISRAFAKGISVKNIVQSATSRIISSPISTIGFDVFGPYLAGKLLWLNSAVIERKIRKVLFFARDAQIEMESYREIFHSRNPEIELTYVHISRASILHASFVDFSMERVWSLISGGKTRKSVGQWLSTVGISTPWIHIESIRRCGFTDPDELVSGGDQRMHQLICLLFETVLENSRKARLNAIEYLRPFIENQSNVAIVDIGWLGNMQASFEKIARIINPEIVVHGFYSGTLDGAAQKATEKSQMHGFFCDNGWPNQYCQAVQNGGAEILEFAHSANHGTTLGYARDGKTVKPILDAHDLNSPEAMAAAQLQKGMMDFCQKLAHTLAAMPSRQLISDDWPEDVLRLITQPNRTEADIFGEIEHSESVGQSVVLRKIAPKLHGFQRIKISNSYRSAKKSSFWPSGFKMRNSFKKD